MIGGRASVVRTNASSTVRRTRYRHVVCTRTLARVMSPSHADSLNRMHTKVRRDEGFAKAKAKAQVQADALKTAASGADAGARGDAMELDEAPAASAGGKGAGVGVVKQEEGSGQGEEDMVIGEDEDDLELSRSLARARKAMLDKKKTMVQLDVGRIKEEREARVKVEEEDDELQSKSGGMVLTTTMEFCNNLKALEGQKKPVARTNPHVKPERKVQDTEEQEVGRRAVPASSSKPGKWESKNMLEDEEEMQEADAEDWKKNFMSDEEDETATAAPAGGALEKEALASGSMADALRLMRQKGYKKETLALAGRTHDERDVNEGGGHWADKLNEQQMRSLGIAGAGKKDIVISRLDEFGREMTTKEAWRHLNHNFHGKKPGARKVEKRKRQFEEEVRLKKMNVGDQAVDQMKKVHSLQEKAGTSHVVLSAGGGIIQNTAHLLRK